ncbi:MAG: hypothetical protein J5506_08565 [Prevotella sp.]|nr:hypothetical protein [Prevotella sp.]
MVQNEVLSKLLEKVEQKVGRELRSPSDFKVLSGMFGDKERISESTLKRLWNYVPNKHKPREDTLDILAIFVGYESWVSFQQQAQADDDSDFLTSTLMAGDIGVGVEILLKWYAGRVCRIRKLENGRFLVVETRNCKLMVGDEFSAAWFAVGQPLCATGLVRNGQLMPNYMAGKTRGLTHVSILEPTPTLPTGGSSGIRS